MPTVHVDTFPHRPSGAKPVLLMTCAGIAAVTIAACNAYLAWFPRTSATRFQVIPFNANAILNQCAQLKSLPGPPLNFEAREISDRYEAGTGPTHIRNATIWTGARNGTEIVYGDVYLEKGIVKGIGYIPQSTLDSAENLTVVDAKGGWVTPGLGEYAETSDHS